MTPVEIRSSLKREGAERLGSERLSDLYDSVAAAAPSAAQAILRAPRRANFPGLGLSRTRSALEYMTIC